MAFEPYVDHAGSALGVVGGAAVVDQALGKRVAVGIVGEMRRRHLAAPVRRQTKRKPAASPVRKGAGYSDALVYRIIERITVLSKEEIRIRFIGGFEITQPLH